MIIESIRVEEGFLDGLDLELSDGLNVLVGPRGSGKTSVIELLRFCIGAPTVTQQAGERARRHALSVLGAGKVVVTVLDGGLRSTVSRTADDAEPQTDDPLPIATILAQNEIERVGLQEMDRLRLIDAFLAPDPEAQAEEARTVAQLRSLTAEIGELRAEIEVARDQIATLSKVPDALVTARTDEEKILKTTTASTADRRRLHALQTKAAAVSLKTTLVTRHRQRLEQWGTQVAELATSAPKAEVWPDSADGPDLLQVVRTGMPPLIGLVEEVVAGVEILLGDLSVTEDALVTERSKTSEATRAIRVKLERLQEGAGEATRRVQALEEQASQLTAIRSLRAHRSQRMRQVSGQRDTLFDRLGEIQQVRYRARVAVGKRLNRALGPRIHVEINQGATDRQYQDAIATSLRGSGLHHSSLAPMIAENMSPRELIQAIETGDLGALAVGMGLTRERAGRVMAQLRANGLEAILAAQIDDGVRLTLLDGSEYKPTTSLSTGQRCTVVLPIVLSHRGSPVVVDQPEDHLDNAFIADTVITALNGRLEGDQILVSTHNANIPVLAEADRVFVLGSDGKRGFIRHWGMLDDSAIVEAISTVMEGGREAFASRAAYYRQRG